MQPRRDRQPQHQPTPACPRPSTSAQLTSALPRRPTVCLACPVPPPAPARRLPARVKAGYLYLHNERHYSDLTLFAGMLAVPVVVGLSFICMLDAYYSRRPLDQPPPPRPHFD